METPKLGVSFIFNVQLYIQSESNAIKDSVRPALSTCVFYYTKLNIENGRHAEFWSFHVSEAPSNPQLTLVQIKIWVT